MTLWNLYNNNQPPVEPQKEALNLSDPAQPTVKRDLENRESPPLAKKLKEEDDSHKMISPTTHIKINSRGELLSKSKNHFSNDSFVEKLPTIGSADIYLLTSRAINNGIRLSTDTFTIDSVAFIFKFAQN